MLLDPDSLPLRLCIIALLIALHGFFTAINTAMTSAGRIIEKYQAALRLLEVVTCAGGAWLSFSDWRIAVGYLVLIIALGQYFPHKLGLQHDEGMTEKLIGFVEVISTVLRPVTVPLMLLTNLTLKILKQKTHVEDEVFSEEDVMSMLEAGKESGALKEEGTKMINSMDMEPEMLKLFPLEREDFEHPLQKQDHDIVTFRPSPEKVMDHLVPNYMKGLIFGVLVEAFSSEQNARITAMSGATTSASEMIKELSLQYNRARQAAITQEITEIVSGANAQKDES